MYVTTSEFKHDLRIELLTDIARAVRSFGRSKDAAVKSALGFEGKVTIRVAREYDTAKPEPDPTPSELTRFRHWLEEQFSGVNLIITAIEFLPNFSTYGAPNFRTRQIWAVEVSFS